MASPQFEVLAAAFLKEMNSLGLYIKSERFEDTFRFVDSPDVKMHDTDFIAYFFNWCQSKGAKGIAPAVAKQILPKAQFGLKRITGGEVFRPDLPDVRFIKDKNGCYSLNTFNAYEYFGNAEMVKPDLSFYFEALDRVFRKDADYFDNWIAYKLQNPTAHLFGWLVESKQGTGKSFILDYLLSHLVGKGQYYSPRSLPVGNFDLSGYVGKLLVNLPDPDPKGKRGASHTAYECIKPLITDTFVQVEKKYEDQRMANLYCAVFISYNSDRAGGQPPIALPADDRRFYVPARCEHRISEEETNAFYLRFLDELARCCVGRRYEPGDHTAWHDALYDYLINKKISPDFNPMLPRRTERFNEVVLSCRPGLLDLIDALASYAVITHNHARTLAVSKDDALIRDGLVEAGFVRYRDGKLVRFGPDTFRRNIWYHPARFGGREPTREEIREVLDENLGVFSDAVKESITEEIADDTSEEAPF
ncbi:primase-helicase family protein [Escherichia coli]|uniref:primase-helicase family protein n=1 Tax=Escherichia coli TaxID=562 RepID=UPI000BB7B73A|nr:primase-helicase family protein [Escherichia coli]